MNVKVQSLTKFGVLALVLTSVFASGTVAAVLFATPIVPRSLSSSSSAATAPVVRKEFADTRTVQLDFAVTPKTILSSALQGRVTSSKCSAGTAIHSGESFLDVDNEPQVLLATAVPLWRDIAVGTQGDDVKALQQELKRLGYPLTSDGVAGAATMRATAQLFKAAGHRHFQGASLPSARIMWIPSPTAVVDSCGTSVGEVIGPGDTLAVLDGALTRVSIQQAQERLVPGERVLTLDHVSVPIGADGSITDKALLDKLGGTTTYAETASGREIYKTGNAQPSEPVAAQFSLADPVTVGVVPPNAVYTLAGTAGCVSSSGAGYPVTVVGSQLGQTYVLFDSGKIVDHVDISAKKRPSCR